MPTKRRPLPSLTGIRGVAALWVVCFHLQVFLPHSLPVIREGFRGVDLFFILSGFILMHAHRGDFLVLSRREIVRFFQLRALRIYPLSTIVLLLLLLALWACPGFATWYRHLNPLYHNAFSKAGFVQTLVLANRWLIPDLGDWNPPTWSLSVELLAYLKFPYLAFLLNRERSRTRLFCYAAGLILLMIAFQVVSKQADGNFIGRVALVRALACFPAGIAAYRFCVLCGEDRNAPAIASRLGIIACGVLILCLLVPHAAVLAPMCFLVIISSLFYQEGTLSALLSSKVIVFLGVVSFPLYLLHEMPIRFLQWMLQMNHVAMSNLNLVLILVGFFAFAISTALVLHKVVEQPSHALGRRIGALNRRESFPQAVAVAATPSDG